MRNGLLMLLTFAVGLAIGRWWPVMDSPGATTTASADRSAVLPAVPASTSATTPMLATATTVPETAPVRTPGPPPPPMPPVGTPLSAALPALIARAEAGDVQAATRWYWEARTCQLARPAHGQRPPRDLRSAADQCLRKHHCASLPAELHILTALRLAAINGNDDAAVAYAAMPQLMWMNDPAILSLAPRWPTEAVELLARARERGHALAWLVTAQALTVGLASPDLRRALPADPRGGLAMLWALQQVPQPGTELERLYAGGDWSGLATRLGIAEREQVAIQAEGERLYRRYLASLTHLSAEIAASRRLIEPYANGVRTVLADVSPRCETELNTDPMLGELPELNPPSG
jgi:hypothetical protein